MNLHQEFYTQIHINYDGSSLTKGYTNLALGGSPHSESPGQSFKVYPRKVYFLENQLV